MTERQKMQTGLLYDANDAELVKHAPPAKNYAMTSISSALLRKLSRMRSCAACSVRPEHISRFARLFGAITAAISQSAKTFLPTMDASSSTAHG